MFWDVEKERKREKMKEAEEVGEIVRVALLGVPEVETEREAGEEKRER